MSHDSLIQSKPLILIDFEIKWSVVVSVCVAWVEYL